MDVNNKIISAGKALQKGAFCILISLLLHLLTLVSGLNALEIALRGNVATTQVDITYALFFGSALSMGLAIAFIYSAGVKLTKNYD